MVKKRPEQVSRLQDNEQKQKKNVSTVGTEQVTEMPKQLSQFCMVEISKIKVKERFRDLKKVDYLMESIKNNGQISPIRITKDYVLVFGNHRLEACKRLGLKEIKAEIVEDISEDKAKLDEIEENLVRTELTALEKCLHVVERFKLYKKLNYKIDDENSKKRNDCVFEKNGKVLSDSEIIAESSGYSLRSVQNFKKIGMALTKEAIDKIKGTTLEDNVTALLDIAKVKIAEQQLQIIKEKLKPKPKRIQNTKAKEIVEETKISKTNSSTDEIPNVMSVPQDNSLLSQDLVFPSADKFNKRDYIPNSPKVNTTTDHLSSLQKMQEYFHTDINSTSMNSEEELSIEYKVDFVHRKVAFQRRWHDLPDDCDMENSTYRQMVEIAELYSEANIY